MNLTRLLREAFLAGIEFQIYNEGGTDIEGWEEEFDKWMSQAHVFSRGDSDDS